MTCSHDQPAPPTGELLCAVCGTGSWVEVERHSTGPHGPGTRWSCQCCGAHQVLADHHRRS